MVSARGRSQSQLRADADQVWATSDRSRPWSARFGRVWLAPEFLHGVMFDEVWTCCGVSSQRPLWRTDIFQQVCKVSSPTPPPSLGDILRTLHANHVKKAYVDRQRSRRMAKLVGTHRHSRSTFLTLAVMRLSVLSFKTCVVRRRNIRLSVHCSTCFSGPTHLSWADGRRGACLSTAEDILNDEGPRRHGGVEATDGSNRAPAAARATRSSRWHHQWQYATDRRAARANA